MPFYLLYYFLGTAFWYPGADSGFCLPFIAFLISKGLPEGVYFFNVFASARWADEDDKGLASMLWCFCSLVLGIEYRVLYMLGRHCATLCPC